MHTLTLPARMPAPRLDRAGEPAAAEPRFIAGSNRWGAERVSARYRFDPPLPTGTPSGITSPLMAGAESLGHGLAVFDTHARLRYANTAARSLLVQLRWSSGDIGSASTLPARWSDALLNVCLKGRRELVNFASGGTRSPAATPGAGPVQPGYAALVPIEHEGQRMAFVIFGREELCGAVELELFALRHGITAAEGEVLRQLCLGMPAADIARSRAVSVATVLTQITAIRQKTACRTVRQLLHALSRMPQLRAAA